jgi:hypothetical protein
MITDIDFEIQLSHIIILSGWISMALFQKFQNRQIIHNAIFNYCLVDFGIEQEESRKYLSTNETICRIEQSMYLST